MNVGSLFYLAQIDSSRMGALTTEADALECVRLSRPESLLLSSYRKERCEQLSQEHIASMKQRLQQLIGAWLLTQDENFYTDAQKLFTVYNSTSTLCEMPNDAVNRLKARAEQWHEEGVAGWKMEALDYTQSHDDSLSQRLTQTELRSVPGKYHKWKKYKKSPLKREGMPRLDLQSVLLRQSNAGATSRGGKSHSAPSRSSSLQDSLTLPSSPRTPSPHYSPGSPVLDQFRIDQAVAVSRGSPRDYKLSMFEHFAYVLWALRSGLIEIGAGTFLDELINRDILSPKRILRVFIREEFLAQECAQHALETLCANPKYSTMRPEHFKNELAFTYWNKKYQKNEGALFSLFVRNGVIAKDDVLYQLKELGELEGHEYLRGVGLALSEDGLSILVSRLPERADVTREWLQNYVDHPVRVGCYMRCIPKQATLMVQKREHYLSLAQRGDIFVPPQRGRVVLGRSGRWTFDDRFEHQPLKSEDLMMAGQAVEAIELLLQYPHFRGELDEPDNVPIAMSPRYFNSPVRPSLSLSEGCISHNSQREQLSLSPKSPRELWGDTSDLEQDLSHLLFEGRQIQRAREMIRSGGLHVEDSTVQALNSKRRSMRLKALCEVLVAASNEQLVRLAPPQYSMDERDNEEL